MRSSSSSSSLKAYDVMVCFRKGLTVRTSNRTTVQDTPHLVPEIHRPLHLRSAKTMDCPIQESLMHGDTLMRKQALLYVLKRIAGVKSSVAIWSVRGSENHLPNSAWTRASKSDMTCNAASLEHISNESSSSDLVSSRRVVSSIPTFVDVGNSSVVTHLVLSLVAGMASNGTYNGPVRNTRHSEGPINKGTKRPPLYDNARGVPYRMSIVFIRQVRLDGNFYTFTGSFLGASVFLKVCIKV